MEKVLKGVISSRNVALFDQLADIFSNPLSSFSYNSLVAMLGMFDL